MPGLWTAAVTAAMIAHIGPAENATRIDARLNEAAAHDGFRGQVVLERDGAILLNKGYGEADAGTPNSAETLFYIGSVAKQFTVAVVLQLEAEGKLSRQDPIGRHLPAVPADKSGITIHHLLSHTSGLVSNHADPLADLGRDEFLAWALATEPAARPGEKFSYSNAGYSVLAAIIERTGGESFAAAVRRRTFDPAGMTATCFVGDAALAGRPLARGGGPKAEDAGFDGRLTTLKPTWLRMGPGGIVSNAMDLARWSIALRDEKVMTRAQLDLATTPATEAYGYGWRLSKTTRGTPLHFHDGGFFGFHAVFARLPDERATVVILCNREDMAQQYARDALREFFAGE